NTTIEVLSSQFTLGLQMQANSLQTVYQREYAEKEAELKAETNKALLAVLAKSAPELFKQFGAYMGKKASSTFGSVSADEEEVVDAEAEEVEVTEDGEPNPQSVEKALQAMDPEQREKMQTRPLCATCEILI